MGGLNDWEEVERESMAREYRMRCLERIVDDCVTREEMPGLFELADRMHHYVMTGEHNLPESKNEAPPLVMYDRPMEQGSNVPPGEPVPGR